MCTGIRFVDTKGNMYFGRNLDWIQGYGERVIAVPPSANISTAFKDSTKYSSSNSLYKQAQGNYNSPIEQSDSSISQGSHSKHSVIGMGIIVESVPLFFDCGNDAGLAIAGLNFPQSAHYDKKPKADSINIAAYEFPFWIARNFSSLNEVRIALANTTIIAKPINEQLPVANLHWLIADATGSIVVEYMKDGMHIWENDSDVLTNEPNFDWQRTNLRNYITLSDAEPKDASWGSTRLSAFGSGMGMHGIPGDYSGPARFVKAAFVNSHYPIQTDEKSNVIRLYRTLGSVAVPDGCAKMQNGSYEKTLYTSCFSPSTMTYYYATYDNPQIHAYRLSAIDTTKSEPQFVPISV